MTKDAVLELCKVIGPAHNIDPILALAMCQQESNFRHDVARLEQGFYLRYTEKDKLATTTEVLLAASYGLMQCMGQILREDGYFNWYREFHNKTVTGVQIKDPLGEVPVVKALNVFMERPALQVEWGCIHLEKKIKLAKGDVGKGVLFFNGGGRPAYQDEVMEKFAALGGTMK